MIQGVYSVELGDANNPITPNVLAGDNAYLQITVGSDILVPRMKINSVGYALQAGAVSGEENVFPSDGNVGIGTTDPSTKLEVAGTVSANAFVGDGSGLTGISGGGSGWNHTASENIVLGAYYLSGDGDDEGVFVGSTGNVGIGTNSPDGTLHIADASDAEVVIERDSGSAGDTAQLMFKAAIDDGDYYKKAGIVFERTGAQGEGSLQFVVDGTADNSNATLADTKMSISEAGGVGIGTTTPAGVLQVVGGSTTALAVDSSGEVGIGTTDPNEALHINISDASNPVYLKVQDSSNGTNADPGILLSTSIGAGNNVGAIIVAQRTEATDPGSTDLLFKTSEGTDMTDRMIIKDDGQVGIGTTDPQHNLVVKGASTDFGVDVSDDWPVLRPAGTGAEDIEISGIGNGGNVLISAPGTSGAGSDIRFRTQDSEVVRIQNDGNVGIANTNPTGLLHVSVNALVVNSDDNVGIGTTSPEAKMHVYNGASGISAYHSDTDLVIEDDNVARIDLISPNTDYGYITFGDGDALARGAIQYLHSNNSMRFSTNALDRLTISSGGDVGIGTTNPTRKLTVEETKGSSALGLQNAQTTINANDVIHAIDFIPNTSYGTYVGAKIKTVADLDFGSYYGHPASIVFQTSPHGDGLGYQTLQDRLTIKSSGYVGIGTTNPLEILEIEDSEPELVLSGTRDDGTTDAARWKMIVNSDSPGNGNEMPLRFYLDETEIMQLQHDGNVGISLNDPQYDLDVAGTINASAAVMVGGQEIQSGKWSGTTDIYYTAGKVGIGITNPNGALHVARGADATEVNMETYSATDAQPARLNMRKSSSATVGTKAETASGESLGEINFRGVDTGSNFDEGANIEVVQDGAAGVKVPANMIFSTYSSTAENANQLVLHNDGKVGIGTVAPSSLLHLEASDATIRLEDTDASGHALLSTTGTSSLQFKADDGNNDANTEIQFHIDGGQKMEINSDGEVGIGTIDPKNLLHVHNTTGDGEAMRITNDDTGSGVGDGLWVGVDGSEKAQIINYESTNLNLGVDNSVDLSIESGGNVGIGTTDPGADLDIYGTSNKVRLSYDGSKYSEIYTDGAGGLNMGSSQGSNYLYLSGVSQNLFMYDASGPKVKIETEGSSYFNGGSVGIGTTSPVQLLEVKKATDKLIRLNRGSGGTSDIFDIGVESGGSYYGIGFWKEDGTNLMNIESNGNVGIGTAAPVHRLSVKETTTENVAVFYRQGAPYDSTSAAKIKILRFGDGSGTDNDRGGAISAINYNQPSYGGALAFSTISGGTGTEAEVMRIQNGRLGIGTTDPGANFHVADSGATYTEEYIDAYSSAHTNYAPLLFLRRSYNNTLGTKTDTIDTNCLGRIDFGGVDTNQAFVRGVQITAVQDGDAGDGHVPANLKFETHSSTAVNSNQLVLHNNGNVGIGTTTPATELEVSDGTVKINHQISGTTAIFGTSSNHPLRLQTNSAEHVRIDTNGNVGIATANPTHRLHVKSSGYSSAPIYAEASDGGDLAYLWEDTDGDGLFYVNDKSAVNKVLLASNGNTYFNGGPVGIGTASPGSILHLLGEDSHAYIQIGSTATNAFDRGIRFDNQAGSAAGYITLVPNTAGTDSIMNFYVGGGAGSDIKMVINDNGNVGIGTTAPANKLDTAGTIRATSVTNPTSGTGLEMFFQNDQGYLFAYNRTGSLPKTLAIGGAGNAITILAGGRVGIGTVSPGEQLVVNGAIKVGAGVLGEDPGTMYYDSGAGKMMYRSTSNWVTLDGGGVDYSGTLWTENGGNVYRASGFVGIGITNPQTDLHIKNANPSIYIDTTDTQANLRFMANGVEKSVIRGTSDGEIYFQVGGPSPQTRMVIDDNGRVGIGTTAPLANLHILRSTSGTDVLKLEQSINNTDVALKFTGKDSGAAERSMYIEFNPETSTDSLLGIHTGTAYALVARQDGSVGIGTTAPGAPLHIYAAQDNNAVFESSDGGAAWIKIKDAAAETYLVSDEAAGRGYVGTVTDHPFVLRANNTDCVTLLTNGNVGIGTTAPEYAIDVVDNSNTTVRSKSTNPLGYARFTVRADDNAYSDYIAYGAEASGTLFDTSKANKTFIYTSGVSSNGLVIGAYTDDPLILGQNNAEVMRIHDNGYVGIGPTNPQYFLHVKKTSPTWLGRFENADTGGGSVYLAHGGGYGLAVDTGTDASSGTYALSVNKDGTKYLYVRGDGNVAIGNLDPDNNLVIGVSDSCDGDGITIKNQSLQTIATLTGQSGNRGQLNLYEGNTGMVQLSAITGADNYIMSGDVGIGTTAPGYELEIASTTAAAAIYNTDTGVGFSNLYFKSDYTGLSNTNDILSSVSAQADDSSGGKMVFSTVAGAGGGGTAGTLYERVRIQANGNVGIGTTNPGNFRLNVQKDEEDWVGLIKNTAANAYGLAIDLSSSSGVNYALAVYTATNSGLFVENNGQVGIGTAAPSTELEVIGTVSANAFLINGSPADYVFEDDYDLKSIKEQAEFMWANKHLPALKGTEELGGQINIAERLEQTVEELEKAHVYIEQLNKRIEVLENKQ
ncbi:hypothetical protein ACFL57_04555 [Candidatus Margulisiibacteriota bacterium]